VVELAVVDERQPALGQRLAGRGGEVDDREPSVAELDRDAVGLVVPRPVRVGTAVCDPLGHDVNELGAIGLLVTAGDTAHLNSSAVRSRTLGSAAEALVDEGDRRRFECHVLPSIHSQSTACWGALPFGRTTAAGTLP